MGEDTLGSVMAYAGDEVYIFGGWFLCKQFIARNDITRRASPTEARLASAPHTCPATWKRQSSSNNYILEY